MYVCTPCLFLVQYIVAADFDRIRAMRVDSRPNAVVEAFPPIAMNGPVTSIDYDVASSTVVWVESGGLNTSRIVQAFLNGTEISSYNESGRVEGLRFDPTANLVYYTQPDLHRVCVRSNKMGSSCVPVVEDKNERPLDLVILPEKG